MPIVWMLALGIGYLFGSIPFGLLLTRMAGLGDIRAIGSGNIGATNVLRTGNKRLAAGTLLLDMLKGMAAVLIVPLIVGPGIVYMIQAPVDLQFSSAHAAGLGAFLGHLFPVWLGFKGGKGVAVYIGVSAGLCWISALAFCAVWLAAAWVFRYSSLSALMAAVVTPIAALWVGMTSAALLLAVLSLLMILMHQANIRRLAMGEEPKIGQKA